MPGAETITAVAPRLADGSVSAVSLLEQCLSRIAADDRQGMALHAVIQLNPNALADAAGLDRERNETGVRGPLHGIPLVIKDNIDLFGLATTSGCQGLAEAMPHVDAAQVRRLREAGAIIIAKTNMSELSFEIRSRSSIAGDVRNPFNTAVTAGGSSGGTAAAIAAGFAFAGLGTDTGGSIRVPAAFCGLVGFRPSWGAADMSGIAPLAPCADTVGPLARSVADAALLYAVMTGARPEAALPPGPKRIGVLRQFFGESPEIIGQGEGALQRLTAAGFVIVDPVVLPDALLPDGTVDVVDHEFGPAFDHYLATNFDSGAPASVGALHASGLFLPEYDKTLLRRSSPPADRQPYLDLRARHAALRRAIIALLDEQGLDALIYPTCAVVPKTLSNPDGGFAPELAAWSGLPALTLPVGRASNNVPIGFELLGRSDWPLLDTADEVERALQA